MPKQRYDLRVAEAANKNETPIYSCLTSGGLIEQFQNKTYQNCWEQFQDAVRLYGKSPFLGTRKQKHGEWQAYEFVTYKQVEEKALSLGGYLKHRGAVPYLDYPEEQFQSARSMAIIGVYTKNREEWIISEQAANAYAFTLCPLYDTLGDEALEFILVQTRMPTIVVSGECMGSLVRIVEKLPVDSRHVKLVILLDELTADLKQKSDELQIEVEMWATALEKGKVAGTAPPTPACYEDIQTLCYTSGTTGVPKGVMLTHKNLISAVAGIHRGPFSPVKVVESDRYVSYLPLAHVMERCAINMLAYKGASIGFYRGDPALLLEDLQCMKPTIFISVPRVFNKVFDLVFRTIRERSRLLQGVFNYALQSKISNYRKTGNPMSNTWDGIMFKKIRNLLGGQTRLLLTGSAPLDSRVLETIQALTSTPFITGYGLSETVGGAFAVNMNDPEVAHVGGPFASIEYKLVSEPELEYYVSNNPPVGELWMRGPSVSPGYFLNPADHKAAFTPDGWFRSGDIGCLTSSGGVRIVDRRKNIMKLQQGEYVAPEKVENVYIQAPLIQQIFVDGHSAEREVVAVVVTDLDMVQKFFKKKGRIVETRAEVLNDPDLKAAILTEMEVCAQSAGLKGFEKVKKIRLVDNEFSVENELLTPTFKLRRNHARKTFSFEIDDLYRDQKLDA